ncbi:MAG: LysE family translocator [Pseudomonadales bacterium]|nr:LysE family translocator [Pseudomonadales bacterium]NRA16899.1 LysE family translocator [Oceanospirillaceae bacterium]
MPDYGFWIVFIGTAIALNVAPGPDVLYILTKTISGGKKIGIASSLGVCTGALFHVVIAAVGLSAILLTSTLAFIIVKYIGVGYLLYLAFQAFRSSGANFVVNDNGQLKDSAWKAFKQGVLIDILNPKVAIFFMAFLPQFLREGQGSTSWQLLFLGVLVIVIAIIIETLYVLLASKISHKIHTNKNYTLWLDRVVGVMFVGLGIKLATGVNT